MEQALKLIQALVAPVVMISANGLICLALYNRLAAIVSRARAFHRERFDAIAHLSTLPLDEQAGPTARQHRHRLVHLEEQGRKILRRARLVRAALVLLMVTVLCMLGCSMALGASLGMEQLAYAALACFAGGVGAMAIGCILAIIELARALDPVLDEADSLRDLNDAPLL
jgi:hypothetical protein